LWCRTSDGRPPDSEGLRTFVVDGRAADLPRGARRLRLAAQNLTGRAQSEHLGRQLALLWDDPDRFADVAGGDGT
nr:hypothetical protein [Micromonospora sp. DSM 115978]